MGRSRWSKSRVTSTQRCRRWLRSRHKAVTAYCKNAADCAQSGYANQFYCARVWRAFSGAILRLPAPPWRRPDRLPGGLLAAGLGSEQRFHAAPSLPGTRHRWPQQIGTRPPPAPANQRQPPRTVRTRSRQRPNRLSAPARGLADLRLPRTPIKRRGPPRLHRLTGLRDRLRLVQTADVRHRRVRL